MKQVLGVDGLSIELKCQVSDRIENVKLLLGQAVGLYLYTEPSKVQEKIDDDDDKGVARITFSSEDQDF